MSQELPSRTTAPLGGRKSLRRRLLAGTLAWVCITLAVAGFLLSGLFREHVSNQFRADLQRQLDRLTAGFDVDATGRPLMPEPGADPRWHQPYSGLYWQVNSIRQSGVLRSRSLWDITLKLPEDRLRDGDVHVHSVDGPSQGKLLVLERMVWPDGHPESRWQLLVAADIRPMEAAVGRFNGVLAASLAVLAAGLLMAVFMQVQIGLAPLRHLQKAINLIRTGRTSRLDGEFPAEIQPLIDDFNSVLDRNDRMIEQARTQAGNLAHAVKTPLAVLANAAALEQGDFAGLVEEQVATARRQVDWHLARARAAASAGTPGMRTPVLPALESLIRVMQRVHADHPLQLELLSAGAQPMFAGEEQDLLEMLGNLLDNACKWGRERVTVSVHLRQNMLEVWVEDDGPGLPEESRALVMQRGVRADERVPGSGLGLSIVDELARLYGGAVRLDASGMGGVKAVLVLPAAGS